jgi:hypothetical protein
MFGRALSVRSSLAARSLFTSARPAVALQSKLETRGFKTSPALQNANSALEPTGVIQKYGSLPFWGALAAVAVTKEVLIIDAEFLLACEVGAFALSMYVLAGDSFNKFAEEDDAQQTKQFTEASDFALEMLGQYKMMQQVNQAKPEVLKEYLGEFKAATAAHAKYQTVLPKHAARKAALATLEGIRNKELHEASMAWQATVDTAVANVTAAIEKGDDKLKKQLLDLAILNLGDTIVASTPAQDPVKRLFIEQFK